MTGEIVDSGVCHQAYFFDPDGNRSYCTTATRRCRRGLDAPVRDP
jgi:hypothetical protein